MKTKNPKAVNDSKPVNKPNEVEQQKAAEGPKGVTKPTGFENQKLKNEWTVMVYLAGDNNLAEEMVYALTSMELVGSNHPKYEVFALYDAGLGPATLRIRDRFTPADDLLQRAEESREQEGEQKVEEKKQELQQAQDAQEAIQLGSPANQIISDAINSVTATPGSYDTANLRNFNQGKDDEAEIATQLLGQAQEEFKVAKHNQDQMKKFREAKDPKVAVEALDQLKPEPDAPESVQETLTNFVIETIRDHPANHYMLVLSGHGSGAVGDFLSSNRRFVPLSIPELREVLEAVQKAKDGGGQDYLSGGKIDILGLDSCLMGMVEVAYEVRQYVGYLVGAEGFEANTGWPYDRILEFLRRKLSTTGINGADLAKGIVREYIKFYSSDYTLAEVSTHLTAMHLDQDKIERLAKALGGWGSKRWKTKERGLSQLLIDDLEEESQPSDAPTKEQNKLSDCKTKDNLVLAHWEAQGFKIEQHVDIYDFCELLQKRYKVGEPIYDACEEVKDAVSKLVLFSDYCGAAFQHAHGISIFFPWANITDAAGVRELDHYQSLEFAQKSLWDEFVRKCHKYTQRPPRNGKGAPHLSALNRRDGLFTGKPGKFGVPGSIKFGVPGSIKFGVPGSIKFGVPGSIKFGVPGAIKFGVPGSIKFGVPGSIKFGVPGSIKFGVPGSIKFGGAGSFETSKIASMKNPPIIWYDQEERRK